MAIPFFDTAYYLRMNKDVAAAVARGGITAEEHFLKYGAAEKRNPNGYFDTSYYLSKYTDVAAAVNAKKITAYDHFINYGLKESRDPSSFFDTNYYLKHNADAVVLVYRNEITPFEHFVRVGSWAARTPSPYFDQASYLAANPDVQLALIRGYFVSAYDHFVNYGVAEGRSLGNGINLASFRADKTFTDAIFAGNFSAAYARVVQMAPFLGTFTLPSDSGVDVSKLTVPSDFTPVSGETLYIPVGLDVTGKTIPGYYVSANSPRILSSVPADNASGADPKADIVITFNKDIQIGAAGSVYLYKSDGSLVEVFALKSSAVKVSASKLTINPTDDLSSNGSYYIKIDAGFVKDKDGNNFSGILDTTTLNFSTGPSFSVSNTSGQIVVSGVAAALLDVDLTTQKISGSAIGGNVSNNIDLSGVLSFGAKVLGNTGDNIIIGTRYSDTITGGDGFDNMTGGGGSNVFVFNNTSTKDLTTTKYDTINDWRSGTDNRIDFTTDLIIKASPDIGGRLASVSSQGIVTFNAGDTSFAQHISAVADSYSTANAVVIWQEGSDAYVFVSDSTAGISTNDVLIKLTGVAVGAGLVIAGGDITLIG